MRRGPSEIDLGRRRTTERLMRTEVRVVEEAQLDRRGEVLRDERPQQAQAERVLQRPPQALDQRDRALLPDCSEPLPYSEPSQTSARDPADEATPLVRHEVRRPGAIGIEYDLKVCGDALVALANERGGEDNITVVIARVS